MALQDQPYLPFYVDDWMNNNRLKMCSPGAHGLMISVMCIMHKSNDGYGFILLKQKFKHTDKQVTNFAYQIAKLCAFDLPDVEKYLTELLEIGSLKIEGDSLIQERMVRDAKLSATRAMAGKLGGKTTQKKNKFGTANSEANVQANTKAKNKQNTVNENGIVNGSVSENETGNANEAENGSGLIYQMHQLWLNAWPDYIPDDLKDIPALHSISIKLKRLVEKKNKGSGEIRAATDGEVIGAFEYIITNYPKWYRDNLISLSGLNSKFNDLIATLQKKTPQDEQSAKDLAYILSSD